MAADTANDPEANDPVARLAMILFHHSLYMEQGEFARFAGINASQLSEYERGVKATPRKHLEKAAVAAGFPVELLDFLLQSIRLYRAAVRGRSRADRIFAQGTAAEILAIVQMATDVILEPMFEVHSSAKDRAEPDDLWAQLAACTSAQRRVLVEELEEYWSRELSERVAAESAARATHHPGEAQELAELAVLIAERVSDGGCGLGLFCAQTEI